MQQLFSILMPIWHAVADFLPKHYLTNTQYLEHDYKGDF